MGAQLEALTRREPTPAYWCRVQRRSQLARSSDRLVDHPGVQASLADLPARGAESLGQLGSGTFADHELHLQVLVPADQHGQGFAPLGQRHHITARGHLFNQPAQRRAGIIDSDEPLHTNLPVNRKVTRWVRRSEADRYARPERLGRPTGAEAPP